MAVKKRQASSQAQKQKSFRVVLLLVLIFIAALLGFWLPTQLINQTTNSVAQNVVRPFGYVTSTPSPLPPSPTPVCMIDSLKEKFANSMISEDEQVAHLEKAVADYLVHNPVKPVDGYEPFRTAGKHNMRFENGWALFNVLGTPKESRREELGTSPIIILGVAHQNIEGEWDAIFLETDPEYGEAVNCVPEEFYWLIELENIQR